MLDIEVPVYHVLLFNSKLAMPTWIIKLIGWHISQR